MGMGPFMLQANTIYSLAIINSLGALGEPHAQSHKHSKRAR